MTLLSRNESKQSPYTEEEEAFLRDLADRQALAIDSAWLYRVVDQELAGRRVAEQGLKESQERSKVTFEQASAGMWHVALDGNWLRVTQKLCEITGYDEDELLAKSFQEIAYHEDLQ